jgi:hypothetical protein
MNLKQKIIITLVWLGLAAMILFGFVVAWADQSKDPWYRSHLEGINADYELGLTQVYVNGTHHGSLTENCKLSINGVMVTLLFSSDCDFFHHAQRLAVATTAFSLLGVLMFYLTWIIRIQNCWLILVIIDALGTLLCGTAALYAANIYPAYFMYAWVSSLFFEFSTFILALLAIMRGGYLILRQ